MSRQPPPPRTSRPAIDRSGMDPTAQRYISRTPSMSNSTANSGVGGAHILEAVPEFISTDCDIIIANQNNAAVVLTRDRNADRMSGYGGSGETQCAAIDIVAGRISADPRQVNPQGERVHVNPNFTLDAARIYISQKTDIDDYFGLTAGKVGSPRARSGIAIKADGVRIFARDGIKLITNSHGRPDQANSQGGKIQSVLGIDLIAGNDDTDLQPIVKGDNLIYALSKMIDQVDSLAGIVDSFLMSQMEFNSFSTTHFHISPGFGAPTPPSPTMIGAGISTATRQLAQTKASLVSLKANMANYKINHLENSSPSFINSRHNSTN